MSKYRNTPVVVDECRFASKAEARRYGELRILARAGVIKDLELQPTFKFSHNGVKLWSYTADFAYFDPATRLGVVEDVKSPPTAKKRDFIRNCKMMKAFYGIEVEVVT